MDEQDQGRGDLEVSTTHGDSGVEMKDERMFDETKREVEDLLCMQEREQELF